MTERISFKAQVTTVPSGKALHVALNSIEICTLAQSDILIQSKFIILELTWLQQPSDLHSPLSLRIL